MKLDAQEANHREAYYSKQSGTESHGFFHRHFSILWMPANFSRFRRQQFFGHGLQLGGPSRGPFWGTAR